MVLNIIKISRKPKQTQFGEKISVGLLTKEYGEQTWLNGWQDNINVNWQPGMQVEATVEQKDKWLNFKAVAPSVPPQAIKQPIATPRGQISPNSTPITTTKEIDWEAISRGKVRHGVSLEAIKLGMTLSPETDKWIKQWTDYIMSGNLDIDSLNQPPF
jgi:hypothetical protein